MLDASRPDDFRLSVVVPCYNEAAIIGTTYRRICEVLADREFQLEIVFVNDGSKDATEWILRAITIADQRVKLLNLARNFGHQAAVSAGLEAAEGDAVVVMDADLQDPPEVVLTMIERWRDGYDVVYGVRTKRKEHIGKRALYSVFYRLFRWVAYIDAPLDAGDFSLIDRQVLLAVNRLPEKNRWFRGLRTWVGFKQTGVFYERQARAAGTTKYPLVKLIGLAADGVFNFSTVPLTMVFVLGLAMSIISFTAAMAVLILRTFDITLLGQRIRDVQGFASTILTVLLIGGIQLISIGILGEYIGRIYQEVKSRPPYLVREMSSSEPPAAPRESAPPRKPVRTEPEHAT